MVCQALWVWRDPVGLGGRWGSMGGFCGTRSPRASGGVPVCPLSKGVYGGVCRPGKALGGVAMGPGERGGGALRVPVGLEWGTVGPCGALWVRRALRVPVVWVGSMGLCGFLWVWGGL